MILATIILGLAQAFSVACQLPEDSFFAAAQRTYRMGMLGDFDLELRSDSAADTSSLDVEHTPSVYLLFILCTVLFAGSC